MSAIGRPNCDRSWARLCVRLNKQIGFDTSRLYLDVVPPVAEAALPEQSVRDDLVNVEFVENGISILDGRVSDQSPNHFEYPPCSDWR